jgi:8-oxo-dGTP diphosphatase
MTGPAHCSRCGGELVTRDIEGRARSVCTSCSAVSYVNPVPASAVVIVQEGKILLVKRAIEPKKGLWSLPAGFIEIDETARECAVREVSEETGLHVELDGIVDVASVFDDPRYVCLLVVFSGHVVGGAIEPGDDAAEAGFFDAGELPPIAFKTHARIIEQTLNRSDRRERS